MFLLDIVVVVGGGGDGGGSKMFTALLAMFIVALAWFNSVELFVVFGGNRRSSCFDLNRTGVQRFTQYALQLVFHEAYPCETARFVRSAKVAVGFAIIYYKTFVRSRTKYVHTETRAALGTHRQTSQHTTVTAVFRKSANDGSVNKGFDARFPNIDLNRRRANRRRKLNPCLLASIEGPPLLASIEIQVRSR